MRVYQNCNNDTPSFLVNLKCKKIYISMAVLFAARENAGVGIAVVDAFATYVKQLPEI